jgi:hypothetical protein
VCVTIDGVCIGEWIYWPLIHSTRNYKQSTANLRNLQITAVNTKSSLACSVFTNRSLATASNNGDSWTSRLHVVTFRRISRSSQLTANHQLRNSTDLRLPVLNFITPRRGRRRQDPVPPFACVTVAAGTCLPSRCPETGLVYLPISQ